MKTSFEPCAALGPYVDRYWAWDGEGELPLMLPGTGSELFLHATNPFLVGEGKAPLPRVHLTVPRARTYPLYSGGPVSFLAVRFKCAAFRHFCPLLLGELSDSFPSAEELWGPAGAGLSAAFSSEESWSGRIAIVESFLLERLAEYRRDDAWLDLLVEGLYASPSGLDAVLSASPVGLRQLERRFPEVTGFGPKAFHRVARFQRFVRDVLTSGRRAYLGIALDAGFYDQPQLVREFRSLTGLTPGAYFAGNPYRSHFYNTPLARVPYTAPMRSSIPRVRDRAD